MTHPELQLGVALFLRDGTPLHSYRLEEGALEPACAWVRATALRRGLDILAQREPRVVPVWHPQAGAPFLVGVELGLGDGVVVQFPANFFQDAAHAATQQLLQAGTITANDQVRYLPIAVDAPTPPAAAPTGGLHVERVIPPLPPITARPHSLRALREASTRYETRAHDDGIPVFVTEEVLRDALLLLLQNTTGVETGGVLLGKLYFDSAVPELYLVVTALIPAEGAPAEATRFTFTPEAWAAAHAAIRARNAGEILCGSLHSHPRGITGTDPETHAPTCAFSTTDHFLHAEVFASSPWAISLLLTEDPDESQPPFLSLLGWQYGCLAERQCYLLPAGWQEAPDDDMPSPPARGEETEVHYAP